MKRAARLLLLICAILLLSLPTLAHETRESEDHPFILVFGWRNEPALVGQINGPLVGITMRAEETEGDHEEGDEHDDGETSNEGDDHDEETADHDHGEGNVPVTNAELQVEVTFGPASVTLPLRPAFGEPGQYVADLIPTRPGDYTFRVFGTIGEWEIDEVFTSADGFFSSIEPLEGVSFPDSLPSIVDIMERIAAIEARLDAVEGE